MAERGQFVNNFKQNQHTHTHTLQGYLVTRTETAFTRSFFLSKHNKERLRTHLKVYYFNITFMI